MMSLPARFLFDGCRSDAVTSCETDPQKEEEEQHQPGPKADADQEKITMYCYAMATCI